MGETETEAGELLEVSASLKRNMRGIVPLWRRYLNLPRNVIVIGIVSLLNDASSEIVYPLLPFFLPAILGASPAAIGVIEGAAECVSSLLKLFAGYFSDRRGRRKGLVVYGYAQSSFVRPLLAFAGSWYQVLAIRLTDRLGKGIRSAPRDAMIADAASVEERGLAFGFHRAMDHAGAVAGPLLGLLILFLIATNVEAPRAADYTKLFLLASLPAIASVAVALFFLREMPGELRADAKNLEPPRLSLSGFDSNFKRFLLIVSLFTLSNFSDMFLLIRAQNAGSGLATILLMWAALHTVKVLSSLVGGDLSDRVGRKGLIASGWLLRVSVYVGFAFVSSSGMVWLLFLIYGLYFGLAEGAEKAMVADLVRAEQRGTAYGLYNLAFSLTVFPASLLMGLVWNWRGARDAFILNALIGLLAALLLLSLVKARPPAERLDVEEALDG
ncbi:MAG TPA: MFS transporter [Pyrinomonadaceae bacterium]|jgi:MFS family permease